MINERPAITTRQAAIRIGWITVVLVVVLIGGVVWANRPEAVGSRLCRELAERFVNDMGAEGRDFVVSDSISVSRLDDGSYRVGMSIHHRSAPALAMPFYCGVSRVEGHWAARMTE
jgi:hypothetical protein